MLYKLIEPKNVLRGQGQNKLSKRPELKHVAQVLRAEICLHYFSLFYLHIIYFELSTRPFLIFNTLSYL